MLRTTAIWRRLFTAAECRAIATGTPEQEGWSLRYESVASPGETVSPWHQLHLTASRQDKDGLQSPEERMLLKYSFPPPSEQTNISAFSCGDNEKISVAPTSALNNLAVFLICPPPAPT